MIGWGPRWLSPVGCELEVRPKIREAGSCYASPGLFFFFFFAQLLE